MFFLAGGLDCVGAGFGLAGAAEPAGLRNKNSFPPSLSSSSSLPKSAALFLAAVLAAAVVALGAYVVTGAGLA